MVGQDINKPVTKWRNALSRFVFTWACFLNLISLGIIPTLKYQDVDYTPWLGKYYKTLSQERCPTYISNHMGYPDVIVLLYVLKGKISFLAADYIETMPLMGRMATLLGGIFCPRGSPQKQQETIELIEGRQRAIQDDGRTDK